MEPQSPSPRSNRRSVFVVLAILAVLIVVLLVLLLRPKKSNSSAPDTTTTVSTIAPTTTAPPNSQTLPIMGYRFFSGGTRVGYTTSGSTCVGTGSFAGATEGAPVIIRGADGTELARTKLAAGVVSPAGCTFNTVGPVVVTKSEAYKIEFPGVPAIGPIPITFIEDAAAKGDPLFGVKDG